MAKLSDIVKGARVRGLAGDQAVTVVATEWHGDTVLTVTYKTDTGALDDTMVYDFDVDRIEVENSRPWSFEADADDVRLVSEAYRIGLAHLFDPYLAVRTSSVEPLPHQISAVYQEMLPKLPLRYVLADDPGAGKTIMTGLLIKEMLTRGDLKRCLIVAPGNLVEQWQDELYSKFGLTFRILTNDVLEASASGNAFCDEENNFCIGRLDKLARNEEIQQKLEMSRWDLVVCDEAHKMSATNFGGEPKYTKRYRLGQLLGEITENLLLLTATPHNGKPADFRYFMALVDKDRFAGGNRVKNPTARRSSSDYANVRQALPVSSDADVSDVMRRLVKEELLKFDGRPLFPERLAYTVEYSLSPSEAELYESVTKYVTEEFNRADRLDGKRRSSVGFALTILQRRLASSPEAIYQSLKRRRERLEAKLAEAKGANRNVLTYSSKYFASEDDFDEDDFNAEEFEEMEDDVIDTASASATVAELEAEISTLRLLERKANVVRMSGEDRKWDELSKLLQDDSNMFGEDGRREKLIIFTEHKDTLSYLASKIRSLLGNDGAVLTIKGGMSRDERHRAEEMFKQDRDVRILVATDAAGEGINLQRAHLMINYDLPWNPNRLEQRFGRIHRIGQTEVCHLWNLVAVETREGEVFQRLFNKLETERAALGGKVFDILGRLTFEDRSLRELLLEAVRYGDDPEVKARLNQVVDSSLDTSSIRKLLEEYALTADIMDVTSVSRIREDMERMEARKLEPHFIEAFFKAALQKLGGRIAPREPGRYEVLEVPFSVRSRDAKVGASGRILPSYERICFEKDRKEAPGLIPASLICPGHPLLDAVVSVLQEQLSSALKQGTVFVDDADSGTEPRLLLYIEDSIQDGTVTKEGTKRVVSKAFRFVEIDADANASDAGYAPYLDYRAPTAEERLAVEELLDSQDWLKGDLEQRAVNFAIREIIPRHLKEVRDRRLSRIKKVERAVTSRLTSEIQYWDSRSWELKEKERAGKKAAKLNSLNAHRRAEELAERMHSRIEQLEREKQIVPAPPRVLGGALVIPGGALASVPEMPASADRKTIELAAMRAVEAIERSLGFEPHDVSALKCGYDIESRVPSGDDGDGPLLRMIEVKGRTAGAKTVTVSYNEVLCALNKPDAFILAVVEVDGSTTRATYIKRPFVNPPDYSAASLNYDISRLKEAGRVVLEKEETWK